MIRRHGGKGREGREGRKRRQRQRMVRSVQARVELGKSFAASGHVVHVRERSEMALVLPHVARGKVADFASENGFVGVVALVMLQLTKVDSEFEPAESALEFLLAGMHEGVGKQLGARVEGPVAVGARDALLRLRALVSLLYVILEVVFVHESFAAHVARNDGVELVALDVIQVAFLVDGLEFALVTGVRSIALSVHLFLVRQNGPFQGIRILAVSTGELLHRHLVSVVDGLVRLKIVRKPSCKVTKVALVRFLS